jgi:Kef-type K+ transport system membrane component KefB
MRLLRQPLVVAYIVSGLIAGPLFLNLIGGSMEFFEMFAKFGIVLLLFIVGLSLNFDYIKKIGKSVFIGGILQSVITAFLGYVILVWLKFDIIPALFISVAISFSSTIIVSKLLADKKDSEAYYGRYVTGMLVLQDIIAILILIFLNTVGLQGVDWQSAIVNTVAKGCLLVGAVFIMSRYLLPLIMDRIARSGELLFIFTVAWCFGVASLVYWAGFNIEIGAIIAGISLGASVYQPEIASRLKPLRDFFIVLFFILLGSELQVGDLGLVIKPAIILSVFVLFFDPLALYFITRFLKHTRRTSFLASVTSAQVSEFGFILIFTAKELGFLNGPELTILTLVALITIIVSSYLITYNEEFYKILMPFFKLFGKDKAQQRPEKENEDYDAWIFGYHRVGWKICSALIEKNIKFAVVDFNPEVIARLKRKGIPAYFGDAADIEFLEQLPLLKSKIIISTIPEPDDQKTLIRHIRRLSKRIFIIGCLYHSVHLGDLYHAGADYIMMPHLLGGHWMADTLKDQIWRKQTFKKLRNEQKAEMKERETAGVMHF